MRIVFSVFCALSLLSLPGCIMARQSDNEPLDAARIAQLVPGKTTAKEVVDLLGAPTEVVQLHKRSAYHYEHTVTKHSGLIMLVLNFGHSDARSDRLWVFFDENDKLMAVGNTLASHHTQYAMPWENVHEKTDNDSRDAERFGQATSK